MGIGDFVSDITPDSVENAIEGGVEWVGNRVEDAGSWTADRLDDVGWDSASDWVREQSRSVANRMGAEVEEMDLGQTEDNTKLVYGSPGKIRSTAKQLRSFQKAFDGTGSGLKGLDSSRLKGEAADALRTAVSTQPPKWFTGADACEKAAAALESFADTVTWAQNQAQTAIDVWKEGVKASQDAAEGIASGSTTTTRPSTDITHRPPRSATQALCHPAPRRRSTTRANRSCRTRRNSLSWPVSSGTPPRRSPAPPFALFGTWLRKSRRTHSRWSVACRSHRSSTSTSAAASSKVPQGW